MQSEEGLVLPSTTQSEATKPPATAQCLPRLFWLKNSLTHLHRPSPLCVEAQTQQSVPWAGQLVALLRAALPACTPFPWLCSRKGAWMNLLSFCGFIPLLQPRCHFLLLSQACMGCARCQANLQLALHGAGVQPLWMFLGWYMLLFLSLSERVQATELDRVLFLTGAATDKRIAWLKSLFQKWYISVFG